MRRKRRREATLAEEGIVDEELGQDAIDDTAESSKPTGKPQDEDAIIYALPVCAPYQSLSHYKHRAKLTPGNQKREKAAKQCVEILTQPNGDKAPNGERCVSSSSTSATTTGSRQSAPIGASIAKKQKASGKNGKKNKR